MTISIYIYHDDHDVYHDGQYIQYEWIFKRSRTPIIHFTYLSEDHMVMGFFILFFLFLFLAQNSFMNDANGNSESYDL